MMQLLLLMTLIIAEPLLRSFSEKDGILLPTLVPKMFIESFCLCMEKWQNTIPLLLSFFKFSWQFVMVVFSNCIPSGLSNSLGRKPSSRQENTIGKSTFRMVRVVEVAELRANSK